MARKVIISCAVTGSIHTPSMTPHLPITPRQIADGASGGTATAGEIALAPDWRRDRLVVVAFVQQQRGRAILAAASAPLQNARP